MNTVQYLKDSERTDLDSVGYQAALKRTSTIDLQFLHACIGCSTEANELLDVAKKKLFYGKPIDVANVIEEMGDVLWYIAILCRLFDISLEETMGINIDKLKARFPEKFNEYQAINRDLEAERQVLEKGVTA